MGSGSSSHNRIPPKNSTTSQQPRVAVQPSAASSVDEPFASSHESETNALSGRESISSAVNVEAVVTLWKPTISEELAKEENDNYYLEGNATVNLAGDQKKKKKKGEGCSCVCCGNRGRGKGGLDGDKSSADFDDTSTQAEVVSVKSAKDMLVIPSEAFPLTMVSSPNFPVPAAAAASAAAPSKRPSEPAPANVKKVKSKKNRRTQVPVKPDKPMSLWSLIKSAIGKDITKFPLPVNFAEPLSMLQRLAEDYEFASILDRASRTTDSMDQLAMVAAFTISSYATTAVRTAKPFNPLLGETYEFDRTNDLGWRCIAEQVCHHPPIAALHCEAAGWVHWQQFTMKSNFKGTYLEIHPLGVAHLRFKTSENHYTWHKVSTIIRNLYIGKLYIEQEGEMDIVNHTTNETCHLKFASGGMFTKDRNVKLATWHVTGKIFNRAGDAKLEIVATWDKEVRVSRLDDKGNKIDSRILWQNPPLPPDAETHYFFSTFACGLNDIEEGVAPTDSRNRTDQRLMENAQWDEANLEKQRLEDKQRDTRAKRALAGPTKHSTASNITTKPIIASGSKNTPLSGPEDGIEPYYTPCWFSRQRDPISGQYIYLFTGEYWTCKENQTWERCPRIYNK